MTVFTIDIDFFKHFDFWLKTFARSDMFEQVKNFFILAVLLMSKLVAGKSQNMKTFGMIFFHQLIHLVKKKHWKNQFR